MLRLTHSDGLVFYATSAGSGVVIGMEPAILQSGVWISGFSESTTMATINKVQDKGQVTIPNRIRSKAGLMKGDLIEGQPQKIQVRCPMKVDYDAAHSW